MDSLRSADKESILTRLGQDLNSQGRTESGGADWRSIQIPLYHENAIQKIMLHHRQDQDSNGDQEHKDHERTRFVFDVSLSNMGQVQIDGLYHSSKDTKTLDMILRTLQPVGHGMRARLQELYGMALEDVQLSGTLQFQNKPEQWVKVEQKWQPFGEVV